MNEKSRRELIEETFDKMEENGGELPAETSEVASQEVEQAEASESTETPSEYEKEAKADEVVPGETSGSEKGEKQTLIPKDERAGKDPTVTDQEAAQRSGAPPVSWTPEAKKAWVNLSDEVRSQITKREVETQRALTYSANARKFANDFYETIKPFEHLITAQRSTPLAAVRSMMQTAAGLMTGTPEQKAHLVAQIVTGYGVDVRMLDTVLDAALKNPQRQIGQQNLPPHIVEMLKPILETNKRFQEREQREQEEMQIRSHETVEAMRADTQKFPFLDEVRESMADVMEVALRRGKVISLENAYSIAVEADPKLRQAAAQRRKAMDASAAGQTLARARVRKSSTVGAPNSGGTSPAAPRNRREAIEQAFDAASGA